jgi:hypothetical protein
MENPLADLRRESKPFTGVLTQTELTRVQLHEQKNLKNKKKLTLAIREIREFADMLEEELKKINDENRN